MLNFAFMEELTFSDIFLFALVWLIGFILYSRYAYRSWQLSEDFRTLFYYVYDKAILFYEKHLKRRS